MKKQLQNIDAINKLLVGEHKFQQRSTFSYSSDTANQLKTIGDMWDEIDLKSGITYTYEQRDGYIVKTKKDSQPLQTIRDTKNVFINCPKETCICVNISHLDKKMQAFHGMCYDCVIEMEHELKKSGKFNQYAIDRIKSNVFAWISRAEHDVKLLKDVYISSYNVVGNANGRVETIDARMTPEQFAEKIEKDFNAYKESLLSQLTNIENHNEN